MTAVVRNRIPEHPVADLFVNRWLPRACTGEEISDETLLTFFEAVRWAPSSYNSQPWRFLYAKRGSTWFETFLRLLSERNQIWAKNAAVFLVLISKTTFTPAGQTQATPTRNHSFDAGAAWSNFGWHAPAELSSRDYTYVLLTY